MPKSLTTSAGLVSFLLDNYLMSPYLEQILSVSPDLRCHVDIVKITLASVSKGSRILDLGAGGLDKVVALSSLGYHCFAFDDYCDPWHKSSMHDIEKIASDFDVVLLKGSLGSLSQEWNLGKFDMIMLNDVIEHLSFSPLPLLQACSNHLNPGGLLLIHVPSCVNFKKRLKCLLGRSIYPSAKQFFLSEGVFRGHVREYAKSDLQFIVNNLSGFSSAKISSVTCMLGVVPSLISGVAKILFFFVPSFSDSWRLVLYKE